MDLNLGYSQDRPGLPEDAAGVRCTPRPSWQPYIDTCLAAFGPARCMFESNFPVDKGMTGYRVLWNAFKRLAAGLTATEKDRVLHGTAAEFYAIEA